MYLSLPKEGMTWSAHFSEEGRFLHHVIYKRTQIIIPVLDDGLWNLCAFLIFDRLSIELAFS